MDQRDLESLSQAILAPYIQLATALIGKPRQCGGNMFRHQMDTMGILIDYGYFDHTLLKASVIHDLLEDDPHFPVQKIYELSDGEEVVKLVREVSRGDKESKEQFLTRIARDGSRKAKILKVADRISNMISLGLVNDTYFIKRYILETALFVYPISIEVNEHMARELRDLISSRMDVLALRSLTQPAIV